MEVHDLSNIDFKWDVILGEKQHEYTMTTNVRVYTYLYKTISKYMVCNGVHNIYTTTTPTRDPSPTQRIKKLGYFTNPQESRTTFTHSTLCIQMTLALAFAWDLRWCPGPTSPWETYWQEDSIPDRYRP